MADDAISAADTLVEAREELMVPTSGGNPISRKAHFLKPIISEHDLNLSPPPKPLVSSRPGFEKLGNYNLQSYKGLPSEKWKFWVQSLKPRCQEIWKKAGIYDAILASTCTVPKDKMLIFGLAERWCADTNTFMFPWGEVTITLEDVIHLGCFSVLGASFSTPLDDECIDIFKCLKNDHKKVRLGHRGNVHASSWMECFMCSGNALEHEAFLALWLSRFVLVRPQNYIGIQDFRVAIHLSRGIRIALAPVVLACIYRDMRLLQNSIAEFVKLESVAGLRFISCHYDLVQMWVWERFTELRPVPNAIGRREPRSLRWNGVTNVKVNDLRLTLDSAGLLFLWRPYVIISSNSVLSNLYKDDEQWVVVDSDAVESFARCLRASALVGLGYTEMYLPHRVAKQFGLDQDLPRVVRFRGSPETAWSSYNRPVRGVKLYIPPRLHESDVSSRYVAWYRSLSMVTKSIQNKRYSSSRQKVYTSPSEPVALGVQSMSSSCKCKKSKLPARKRSEPKVYTVVNSNSKFTNNHVESGHSMSSNKRRKSTSSTESKQDVVASPEANIVNVEDEDKSYEDTKSTSSTESKQDVVVSPEANIVNVEDEDKSYEDTATELQHLGLAARIWRLERIFDKIKAARFCVSVEQI